MQKSYTIIKFNCSRVILKVLILYTVETMKQQNCMIMTRDGNDIEQNEDPRFDRFRFHYTKKTQEPEKF